VWAIHNPEPSIEERGIAAPRQFWGELKDGARAVWGNPVVRRLAGASATNTFGDGMVTAVYLIFAYRHLHLSPGIVGLVYAVAGVGSVAGTALAPPTIRKLRAGRTFLLSALLSGLAQLTVPAAQFGPAVLILMSAGICREVVYQVWKVNQLTLRQSVTPDRMQGRMNATYRTITWGMTPLGALVGGFLGASEGVVPVIIVGALIQAGAALWLLGGPTFQVADSAAASSPA